MADVMFLGRNLFEENMALQCEVKALYRQVGEFKSGERYLKIQEDYRKVERGYIREINKLKSELASAHAQTVTVRNLWMEQNELLFQELQAEIGKQKEKNRKLEDTLWQERIEHDRKITELELSHEDQLHEKDCIIQELKNKLAHAEALLGRDSTNTNLPTGQTPPGKKKHIPNSRRGSGKKKGGQPGHPKHTLEKPSPEEITDVEDHLLTEDAICPTCGCRVLIPTGEWEEKCETDIEVIVKKTMHKYWLYHCCDCGETVRTEIDPNHRAECSYGPMVQATALSLMTTSNTAINKVPVHLSGITDGDVVPSEGYIAKLMPRAAKRLGTFMQDLFRLLIIRTLVFWDDTVVMADSRRICLRFYGDEKIAYYVAHDKKDMNGILEDGILTALTKETYVMHDHNSINYNARFLFINLECNAHLQRDLQKSADETGHGELLAIKDLISGAIKERNDLILKGIHEFTDEYKENFNQKLTDLLDKAEEKAEANTSIYSGPDERALVRRIKDYRENFFPWIEDFSLPTTNNLSERSLRGVKTKMKVSGQFASSKTADNYARVRSYIETCRRNGINEIGALIRLCEGNPYTVEEIFSTG